MDGRELPGALAQFFFGAFALREIADGADPDDTPVIGHVLAGDLHWKGGAVLAVADQFVRLLVAFADVLAHQVARLGRGEVEHIHADQLV